MQQNHSTFSRHWNVTIVIFFYFLLAFCFFYVSLQLIINSYSLMKRILTITLMLACILIMRAQSDVDNNIAVNDQKDPNTFVLIISNENYKYEQSVPFALNDGNIFKLYCEKTLGIPTKNIRYAPDATLNDMRMQLTDSLPISFSQPCRRKVVPSH